MEQKRTEELLQILNNTSKRAELERFLHQELPSGQQRFLDFLSQLMLERGCDKSELIAHAGIARTYGYQVLNGQKHPGRDKVLAIALTLSLSLPETQRLLTLAETSVLYAKRRRDAILIFALQKHCTVMETEELLLEMGEAGLE